VHTNLVPILIGFWRQVCVYGARKSVVGQNCSRANEDPFFNYSGLVNESIVLNFAVVPD
jgi:hypothetical protein